MKDQHVVTVLVTGQDLFEIFGFKFGLILNIPGGLFEIILPIWLFVRGFNSSVIASGYAKTDSDWIK